MTIAINTLVRQVRDILGDDDRWQTVATVGTAGGTTVAVTDGTDWNEGSIIEWQNDGDQAYVQSVSANNLTVIRSVNGTTGTVHAAGATGIAVKDPTYSYIKTVDAIDATISTLWPWAWYPDPIEIVPVQGQPFYELAFYAESIISAVQQTSSTDPLLGMKYYGTKGVGGKRLRLIRDLAPITGSPIGIEFPDGFFNYDDSVWVTVQRQIFPQKDATNYLDLDIEQTFMPTNNIVECITWGAASRLVKAQSASRARRDARQWDNTYDLQEINQTADFYYQEYRKLLMDVNDHLTRQFPPMRTWSR